MKTLIVYVSISNANTRRVARAMGEVLRADVLEPEDVDPMRIGDYDIVGFGSGIYFMAFHRRLREFVDALPDVPGRRAFLFCTSGSSEPRVLPYTKWMTDRVAKKGFEVVGTFSCRGLDTWLPLRLVGGINKGKPDAEDLERARSFARDVLEHARPPHAGNGPRASVIPRPIRL